MVFTSGGGDFARPKQRTPYEGTRAAGCETKATVYLDTGQGEIEVPLVSLSDDDQPALETHIRKGGTDQPSIVRLSDLTVPLEWGGDEIQPVREILTRQPDRAPTVRIELKDPEGDYSTIHHGYVRAIAPHQGNAAVNVTVGDWSDLFRSVGFGNRYGHETDATAAQVITDAVNVVAEEHPMVDELRLKGGSDELPPNAEEDVPSGGNVGGVRFPVAGAEVADLTAEIAGDLGLLTARAFTRTEDTAATAISWAVEKIGGRWEVHWDPEAEAPTIYVDTTDNRPLFQDVRVEPDYSLNDDPFAAPLEGRPLVVEQNNAAFQISPFYVMKGRGSSTQSIERDGEKIRDGEWRPTATVAHKTLREYVGGSVGKPPIEPVDSQSIDEVIATTRQRLMKEIREAAGGEIITLPEPGVVPGAIVEAVPVCGGQEVGDYPELRLEAQEIVHHISPVNPMGGTEQKPSRTLIRCGLATRKSDFVVLDSGMQKI